MANGAGEAGDRARDGSSREKILEVAEALYARRGFAGVGMREVAESAGLGKSSLFHHFRSKVQLYLAVLERVLGRLDDRLGAVLSQPLPPAEKLDRWMDVAIDTFAEQPASARILLRAMFEEDEFDGADWPEGQALDRRLTSVLEGLARLLLRSLVEDDATALPPSGEAAVEARIAALVSRFTTLLAAGVATGELREVHAPDAVQTLIGATVYHFASGEFGEALLGGALYSAEAVARRKREVKELLLHGLASRASAPKEKTPS